MSDDGHAVLWALLSFFHVPYLRFFLLQQLPFYLPLVTVSIKCVRTQQDMSKLVNIVGLSTHNGIPVRTLRSFMASRKIPFLKCGHRTVLFDPQKVDEALGRFEVKAVTGNEARAARTV